MAGDQPDAAEDEVSEKPQPQPNPSLPPGLPKMEVQMVEHLGARWRIVTLSRATEKGVVAVRTVDGMN